ncbi:MAG TPA: hypothetical protein VFM02_02780 [Candidatus Paceibacterota bacterium]|nr:hypothetical protein [Candidatus Paceibacterota bacterium]
METLIENYVLPFRAFVGLTFAVLLVFPVLGVVSSIVTQPIILVQNASCRVVSVGVDSADSYPFAKLSCDVSKKTEVTKNAKFIIAYLKDPGPASCTLYDRRYADCTLKKKN